MYGMVGLKKFLSNKNTVTIICVILGIAVLYYGYDKRINDQIQPKTVPYAKTKIEPGTLITSDMVGTIEVPPAMLQGNPYTDMNAVVNKYSQADSIIPEGSLFYSRSVVTKDELPDGGILGDYPDGWVLYSLDVDITSTYGNSILPDSYIDIYVKVTKSDSNNSSSSNKVMVGKLFKNVKVLAVKDSSGNSVFKNNEEQSTPSQLIFALPSDYWYLLTKAAYLRSYDTDITPVPTDSGSKDNTDEVTIGNEEIEKFINSVTEEIKDIS